MRGNNFPALKCKIRQYHRVGRATLTIHTQRCLYRHRPTWWVSNIREDTNLFSDAEVFRPLHYLAKQQCICRKLQRLKKRSQRRCFNGCVGQIKAPVC